MVTVLFTILGLFTLLYLLLVGNFIRGWQKLSQFEPSQISHPDHFFSVIIPARNEERNITACLQSLVAQEFDPQNWEIIVVDDHSEDATAAVARQFISVQKEAPEIKLVEMQLIDQESVAFKKRALERGIAAAKGDWIITTDADTHRGQYWLATLSTFIANKNPVFVSAPVTYHQEKNFFEKLQSLEFLSLIGIGAASISNGSPNMCNGANLAFSHEAFKTVGGYSDISHLASGDDEFLMHKLDKAFPGKVMFLKNLRATVFTQPAHQLRDFVMQRKRWVSKSTHYSNRAITAILTGAYLYHLLLLFTGTVIFIFPQWLPLFLLLFFLKLLIELAFLVRVTSFFKRKSLLILFLPAAAFYIFYVLFIGIYGNAGGYTWKGRKVK